MAAERPSPVMESGVAALAGKENPMVEEEPNRDYRGLDFHLRLNAEEKRRLIDRAQEWNASRGEDGEVTGSGSLSRYARAMLLAPKGDEQSVTREELVDWKDKAMRLTLQIAKVGVNINQLARVANARGVVLDKSVLRLVGEMKPLMAEADNLIRGMMERNL